MRWRLWIQDNRARPWSRSQVHRRVELALRGVDTRVERGPFVVFDGRGTHPGEWCFEVDDPRDRPQAIFQTMVAESLWRIRIALKRPPDQVRPPGDAPSRVVRRMR